MTTSETKRYTAVAIVLHWAIALTIFGMIPLGWWMSDAIDQPGTQAQAAAAFQLHKSIGLTVLALSVARLLWRLAHKPPPMPPHMAPWERIAAVSVHWAFYAIIIIMPLTGWLYVSTGWEAHDDRALEVPTLYFGLIRVPHLFGLTHLDFELRSWLSKSFEFAHSKLAWGAIGLAVVHVGAALKHHVFDQDDVLTRMVPGLRPLTGPAPAPASPLRVAILGLGGAAIVIAAGLALFAFLNPPRGSAPAAPSAHEHAETSAPAPAAPEPSVAETPAASPSASAAPTATAAAPPIWRVNYAASAIRYSGAHVGTPFEGRFSRWRADIRFDPNNLEASRVSASIETASASDGDSLHDGTLPGAEWFDVANHPTARFEATRFVRRGDGGYEARGSLTLKGRRLPMNLPFTLAIAGDRAVMDGQIEIDRAEADLGQSSDPDGEFVSPVIGVQVHVEAQRAP